jgi:hypothetical protein
MSFGSPSWWRGMIDPQGLFHGPGSGGKNFLANANDPSRSFDPFAKPPPPPPPTTSPGPTMTAPNAGQNAAVAAAGGGFSNPLTTAPRVVQTKQGPQTLAEGEDEEGLAG